MGLFTEHLPKQTGDTLGEGLKAAGSSREALEMLIYQSTSARTFTKFKYRYQILTFKPRPHH